MANGKFEVNPGVFMEAQCHHRQHGACGACYARLVTALERCEEAPTVEAVKAICAETTKAMVSEARRPARLRRSEGKGTTP